MSSRVGGLGTGRIGTFHSRDRICRYAAIKHTARTALMRHFVPPASAPSLLTRGVMSGSTTAALIPYRRTAQRFTAADLRTALRAINIAVIATATDAHLHPAPPAVVEPIARPLQRPQRLPPKALDSTPARQA
jgi:hypothetical protein